MDSPKVRQELTTEQAARLLAVVKDKERRNWDWLIEWLNDEIGPRIWAKGPEETIRLFEDDEEWATWPWP